MKLYWGPHTCAIGIHILLEEIGKPYELEKVDVAGGAARQPAFLAVNPKGKVPALVRDDGAVLTEFGAIAAWLAHVNPEKKLFADDPEGKLKTREVLDYVVGTVHPQGFGRILEPQKFEPKDFVHEKLHLGREKVQAEGREMVEKAFAILDRQIAGHDYAVGNTFSIADAALFYVERWAPQKDIPLPPNLSAHLARMKARPAVKKVMEMEGET